MATAGVLAPQSAPWGNSDPCALGSKRLKVEGMHLADLVDHKLQRDQAPQPASPNVIKAGWDIRDASFSSSSSRESSSSPSRSICSVSSVCTSCDLEYLGQCLQEEHKASVNPRYLTAVQTEMDGQKRLVLVDWLVEVCDEFGLRQETLFLAVNIMDRYLSAQRVRRTELQLVAVTSLWLACKYEEVYPPVLADFVDVTMHAYRGRQLVAMEARILGVLGFELGVPTAISFLHQLLSHHDQEGSDEKGGATPRSPSVTSPFSMGAGTSAPPPPRRPAAGSRRMVHLAEYLLELSLLAPDALRWRPSVLAAAALRSARKQLHATSRDELAETVVGDAGADVLCAAAEMTEMARWASRAPKRPMVWTKYSGKARSQAALLALAWQ